MDIAEWLRRLELDEYEPAFRANAIDDTAGRFDGYVAKNVAMGAGLFRLSWVHEDDAEPRGARRTSFAFRPNGARSATDFWSISDLVDHSASRRRRGISDDTRSASTRGRQASNLPLVGPGEPKASNSAVLRGLAGIGPPREARLAVVKDSPGPAHDF